jgi:transcriptional regulator with XRE-family HTH domain
MRIFTMLDDHSRSDVGAEPARVFGHLTLIRPTGEFIRGVTVYECRCACGNLDKATIPLLMMGRKTSCGCQNRTRTEVSKPETHEIERLRVLVLEDGRPLAEIAEAAGLGESLISEGLGSKKRLTLATTCSLLKALGRRWSDLDEPVAVLILPEPTAEEKTPGLPLIDLRVSRFHMPHTEWVILPNGARPRHLASILTRNRLATPKWFLVDRAWMAPFTGGEGLTMGSELY